MGVKAKVRVARKLAGTRGYVAGVVVRFAVYPGVMAKDEGDAEVAAQKLMDVVNWRDLEKVVGWPVADVAVDVEGAWEWAEVEDELEEDY